MQAAQWVDFKAVKARVTVEMALQHYSINGLKKSRDELRGKCPIHNGEGTDTFHVSLTKNAFQCFSCKSKGNVLDFVAAMEQCSVRDAAVKLSHWFALDPARALGNAHAPVPPTAPAPKAPERGDEKAANKTLSFQLKGIDHAHAYLQSRGMSEELAREFGIGFFPGKGSMAGRVVIPIHNERGELLAYAGRSIDDSEPKYKLPAGFHQSLVLYNLHRALQNNDQRLVVVVEGYFDCLKVHEAGFPCVALMGSSLSKEQEEQLAKHFRLAWLLFDGDEAGRSITQDCSLRLLPRMFVRVGHVGDGRQPDELDSHELNSLLS